MMYSHKLSQQNLCFWPCFRDAGNLKRVLTKLLCGVNFGKNGLVLALDNTVSSKTLCVTELHVYVMKVHFLSVWTDYCCKDVNTNGKVYFAIPFLNICMGAYSVF